MEHNVNENLNSMRELFFLPLCRNIDNIRPLYCTYGIFFLIGDNIGPTPLSPLIHIRFTCIKYSNLLDTMAPFWWWKRFLDVSRSIKNSFVDFSIKNKRAYKLL